MGSPIDVGGQYPFITFFTPPRLSGKFLLFIRFYLFYFLLQNSQVQEIQESSPSFQDQDFKLKFQEQGFKFKN